MITDKRFLLPARKSSGNEEIIITPYSLEAEIGLLGCILIDAELFVKAKRFINETHFYVEKHRIIWNVFERLNDNKTDIDTLTVVNKLKELGRYEGDMPRYLVDLMSQITTTGRVNSFLQIVLDKWKARSIQKISHQLRENCNEEFFSDIMIEEFKAQIDKVCHSVKSDSIYRFGEGMQQFIQDIEDRRALYVNGIPYSTTIRDLDRVTGGLERKTITVIGAKSSVGKTSFCTQMAYALAYRGNKVLYYTTEMPEKEIRNRIVCSELHLDYFNVVRKGILNDEDRRRIETFATRMRGMPLHIYFKPALTMDAIRADATKEKADFVFVDYFQQMKIPGKTRPDLEYSFICNSMKEMAGELNCGVIILSQFSRDFAKSDRTEPKISDLKETGGLEIAGDLVLLLHRHAMNYEDDPVNTDMKRIQSYSTSVIVSKQRNGPSDIKIETIFMVKPMRFEQYTEEDETGQ